MRPVEITEGVHWVGVLDPQLRVFDIIMKADHGTTYNSYLLTEGEKIAVVDTVKATFYEEFLENVRSIVDPADVSYVIVNHTEPDHSGSLDRFLREAPNAQVVCDRQCRNFVKNILNRDVEPILVQDGDTLDLGKGVVLRFVHAPFLHWPDTMFTYLEKDGILFTCDFLGAHYCDDRLFDDLVDDYSHAFEYYYMVIFRPFKKYVLEALDKVERLNPRIVAPSHGPVLRSNPRAYMDKYRQWSSHPAPDEEKKLLVFYASAYGNTAALAEKIAEGARSEGVRVTVMDVAATELGLMIDRIEAADGIAVGSATINGDAVEPVWYLLSHLATLNLKGKVGAAFGSYGWSGEAPKLIAERLRGLKFKVEEEPLRVNLVPTEGDLEEAVEMGKRLARSLREKGG
ncbi:FprA family A-type flavoprotein [Candidatus Solincola tengchongensis]|uniref:FprA family A-type flavoprotein n=1 Tax=Candidatus Solincola tengchongensis TaxID=2900693 RepID=UPI00257A0696|nr:FprA family A-type flavoprotein [Candidatus Solincola tengchongensis]